VAFCSPIGSRASLAAAPIVAVLAFVSATARAAEPRLSMDWGKLGDFLHEGSQAFARGQSLVLVRPESSSGEDEHFADMTPHLSLVARDWSASQLFTGRLSLTDQMRLIRSTRMVLTRIRVGSGRFVPFAQMGLGQWRVDGDLMPAMAHNVEPAGQVGGGFELTLAPGAVLAWEAEYTILCPLDERPQPVPDPEVWASSLVARAHF
jgi:hypothetical protein